MLPHFQYCFTVWHHCGARNAEKLEALTKRILTLLKDYSSSYDQLLDKVNLNFLCLWVYAYVKKNADTIVVEAENFMNKTYYREM